MTELQEFIVAVFAPLVMAAAGVSVGGLFLIVLAAKAIDLFQSE